MSSPKEFHIDAVYPEPLSRLRRGHGLSTAEAPSSASYRRAVKKQRNRGSAGPGRFRTQPVTFQEIKEVDEDNIVEPEIETLRGSFGTIAASSTGFKSESDLKASFQQFYQSIKCGNDDEPGLDFPSPLPSDGGGVDLDKHVVERPQSSINSTTTHPLQSSPIVISLHTRSRQSF